MRTSRLVQALQHRRVVILSWKALKAGICLEVPLGAGLELRQNNTTRHVIIRNINKPEGISRSCIKFWSMEVDCEKSELIRVGVLESLSALTNLLLCLAIRTISSMEFKSGLP